MAMTIHVDVVSAEREIYSGAAEQVFAPAIMGEVGILPRHAPLLTQLQPGEVRVKKPDGEEDFIYVSGGMLEVLPHVVTVLSDTAIRARDLDEASALEAKQEAEQALQDNQGEMEYAQAEARLAEAVAQLRAIQNLRKRLGR